MPTYLLDLTCQSESSWNSQNARNSKNARRSWYDLLAQVIHAVGKKVPEIPKNPKMPTCLVNLICQS